MRASRAIVAVFVLLAGCWDDLRVAPDGFSCATADDCGDGYHCLFGTCVPPSADQPSFPIRAALFQVGYPYAWGPSHEQTRYQPTAGYYASRAILPKHLEALAYGQIRAVFAEWWGLGKDSDLVFTEFIERTQGSPLRWSLRYMREEADHPSASDLGFMFADIRLKYERYENYLRVADKLVLFVHSNETTQTCELAQRYVAANKAKGAGLYLVLRVSSGMAGGYQSCASQPDAWVQYDAPPRERTDGDSYTISPGEWHWDAAGAELARDPGAWLDAVSHMAAATGKKFHLVNSFNDWPAGSAVESGEEWASPSSQGVYLDALHAAGGTP